MIQRSADNEGIYACLEKNNQLPLTYAFSQVFGFDETDDYCLVVYSAQNRNFMLFRAENAVQNKDILVELLETVQEFSEEDLSVDLKNNAIQLVEDKLHSKNNSRFFFDAH